MSGAPLIKIDHLFESLVLPTEAVSDIVLAAVVATATIGLWIVAWRQNKLMQRQNEHIRDQKILLREQSILLKADINARLLIATEEMETEAVKLDSINREDCAARIRELIAELRTYHKEVK